MWWECVPLESVRDEDEDEKNVEKPPEAEPEAVVDVLYEDEVL